MNITINLAGIFDGKVLNEAVIFEFASPPQIIQIFDHLNKKYQTKIFSEKSLKKNIFVVLWNGQKISLKMLKEIINSEDVLTIVQPIMGG